MRLTPPKKVTWWISLILVVVGVLGHYASIPVVSAYDFWVVVIGGALLLLANVVKGL